MLIGLPDKEDIKATEALKAKEEAEFKPLHPSHPRIKEILKAKAEKIRPLSQIKIPLEKEGIPFVVKILRIIKKLKTKVNKNILVYTKKSIKEEAKPKRMKFATIENTSKH